jgi:ATP-binding cassette subfamily F protein uup
MEGDGRATVYAGGWSDYRSQRGTIEMEEVAERTLSPKDKPRDTTARKSGLTFTEKHRLETLPEQIAKLEAEIAKLAQLLADPQLFSREPAKFAKASSALAERQAALSQAEEEWLALAEKAEA